MRGAAAAGCGGSGAGGRKGGGLAERRRTLRLGRAGPRAGSGASAALRPLRERERSRELAALMLRDLRLPRLSSSSS